MTSTSIINNYNSDREEFRQKLLEKFDVDKENGDSTFLDTLEKLRQEQRVRLAQAEQDYYNQEQVKTVTSKPPLPKASKRSTSPVLLTEERAQYHMHRRAVLENTVRRHDEEIAFCPHRTVPANSSTTEHMRKQIDSMWQEFELEDYLDEKKYRTQKGNNCTNCCLFCFLRNRQSATSASWAGRITIPAPFALTNSMNVDSVHRRKCMREFEAAKLQKQIDEELIAYRPFKGLFENISMSSRTYQFSPLANPVPAHVHMPLYEQLQNEQHTRSEHVRQMTRQYLNSIQKPFAFDAREKAKQIIRRHSYSGGDLLRPEPQFKAKPMPDFYSQSRQDHEL